MSQDLDIVQDPEPVLSIESDQDKEPDQILNYDEGAFSSSEPLDGLEPDQDPFAQDTELGRARSKSCSCRGVRGSRSRT